MSDFAGFITLVIRGSTVNDPTNTTAPGFLEARLPIVEANAWPKAVGVMLTDGNGNLSGYWRSREEVEIEVMPFMRSVAQSTGTQMTHGGQVRKAMKVLRMPYVWIYNVHADGDAESPTYDLRATVDKLYDPLDEESEEFTDVFWRHNLSNGECPMPVVWNGESVPEHEGGGVYNWNFSLFKVSQELS